MEQVIREDAVKGKLKYIRLVILYQFWVFS